ncbi:hypothetical protein LMG33818_000615 [Halomonadaceae bacterium LMG 33818]
MTLHFLAQHDLAELRLIILNQYFNRVALTVFRGAGELIGML